MPYVSVDHATLDALVLATPDQPQFRVRLTGGVLCSAGPVTVQFRSVGATDTALTGPMSINSATGAGLSFPSAPPTMGGRRPGYMQTAANASLVMVLGGAVQVSGVIEYEIVSD